MGGIKTERLKINKPKWPLTASKKWQWKSRQRAWNLNYNNTHSQVLQREMVKFQLAARVWSSSRALQMPHTHSPKTWICCYFISYNEVGDGESKFTTTYGTKRGNYALHTCPLRWLYEFYNGIAIIKVLSEPSNGNCSSADL